MDNDSDSDVGDLLNDLLGSNEDPESVLEHSKPKIALKELDFNFLEAETNSAKKFSPEKPLKSLVHDENLDSSDEEEKRNSFEPKYSESGRSLKALLKKADVEKHDQSITREVLRDSKNSSDFISAQTNNLSQSKNLTQSTLSQFKKTNTSSLFTTSNSSSSSSVDVYSDPVFGLRIIKPLVSSSELQSLMMGKTPVHISKVKHHLATANLEGDWVIAGVVINKSPTMKSQKGNAYCIWKLSDLSFDMNVVSCFLFNDAYKQLWKTAPGTVIGVMNPNVLESKNDKDQATLSADSASKILILGTSRDMGTCKSVTKAGNPCTSIVNRSKCEYCVYHIQREYKQCSRRADLQSSGNGRGFGPLSANRKGFGPKKIQASITQGQPHNFGGIPAKRNLKLDQKDRERLALLTGAKQIEKKEDNDHEKEKLEISNKSLEGEKIPEKKKQMVELTSNQAKKDFDRLNKLKKLTNKAENESQPSKEEFLNSQHKSREILPNPASAKKEGFTLSKLQEMRDDSATPFSNTPGFTRSKLQEWTVKQGYGTSSQDKNSALSTSKNLNLNCLSKSSNSLSKSNSRAKSLISFEDALNSSDLAFPSIPRLGNGITSGSIDFSKPIIKKQLDWAKLNARKLVREKGGFKKSNVNKILESKEKKEQNLKRKREPDDVEKEDKKLKEAKMLSDKFKQLMEATSSHVNLIEKSEEEEKEKYFAKLEIKEKMEEKMMTTFKVNCKAVTCSICKYTAFSSSDMCKELRHPIRVINALKRFFKCGDCGNRTVGLDKMPKLSCNKCNSSNWKRASMMDEKKADILGSGLSIRGGEEKFIGSYVKDANLNLLVPE